MLKTNYWHCNGHLYTYKKDSPLAGSTFIRLYIGALMRDEGTMRQALAYYTSITLCVCVWGGEGGP